jgi:hypothetical protein
MFSPATAERLETTRPSRHGRHRLRPVLHQPIRRTESLLRSIINILKIDIAIPDHATRRRRDGRLTILPE